MVTRKRRSLADDDATAFVFGDSSLSVPMSSPSPSTSDDTQTQSLIAARSRLALDNIHDRPSDTRTLNKDHAESLAESIKAVGLIQPIAVDRNGILLAGGHRRLAITIIRNDDPEVYHELFPEDMVPVRMMPFTIEENPNWAFDVEISENELRRDYSKEEVLAIAQRLREAGYTDTPGKPKKGEKRLRPALQTIIGKSLKTVQRYLNDEEPPETRTNVQVSESQKLLKRAISTLEKWDKHRGEEKIELEIAKELPQFLELLRKGVE
ncbi:MAG: ParB N-terminal domain-containing protein [Cyanothece sp. SIO2G6]|nr:ParB N-terminal domain-containing protein [Cyanothece sp. SIO2G6]